MIRFPDGVNVQWYQSWPRIDFEVKGSTRGTVTFRGDDPDDISGLVRSLANGYANLLLHSERLKRENKALRIELGSRL